MSKGVVVDSTNNVFEENGERSKRGESMMNVTSKK